MAVLQSMFKFNFVAIDVLFWIISFFALDAENKTENIANREWVSRKRDVG